MIKKTCDDQQHLCWSLLGYVANAKSHGFPQAGVDGHEDDADKGVEMLYNMETDVQRGIQADGAASRRRPS